VRNRIIDSLMVASWISLGVSACDSASECAPNTVTGAGDAAAAPDGTAGPAALGFVPSNLGPLDTSGALGDLVFSSGCMLNYREEGKALCSGTEGQGYRSFEVTQSDGSKIRVFLARNIRIPSSSTVEGDGSEPLALVALDTLEISGTLTVAANHGDVVAGGAPGNSPVDRVDGKGAGGGKPGTAAGGGAYCGKGGPGVGTGGGAGGAPFGMPSLVPLLGGSAGGNGSSGGGGGAIALIAGSKVTISTTGIVNAGGGGASNGSAGGGSGGAVLIEAPSVLIAGKVAANGGSGDAGQGGGGSALDATTDATPTPGPVGTMNTNGGQGGGGDAPDGTAGGLAPTYPDGRFSGAGGGGAGRIRINTATGAAMITGTVSPTVSTPCTTQGMIAR
jgi:hypothetical protein